MTPLHDLEPGTIYEVVTTWEDFGGDPICAGERLVFAGVNWSPHDGVHVLRFEGRTVLVHPADVGHVLGLLRVVGRSEPHTMTMTIADLRADVVYEVRDTFIESTPAGDARPAWFMQGERMTYVDQSFDALSDVHMIRFRERTLTLFRGHDVACKTQRFLRAVRNELQEPGV